MGVHNLSQGWMTNVGFESTRARQVLQRARVSPVLVQKTLGVQSEERARSSWAPAYDEKLAMSGTRQDGLAVTERRHLREAYWFWPTFGIWTTATEYTVAPGEYERYAKQPGQRSESSVPIP